MRDSVPYFVVVRYRNSKLTERRRFGSYMEANEFVQSIVNLNKFDHAVLPREILYQIVDDCGGLPY